MISEKAWKLDALLRLAASVLICMIFLGSLASGIIAFIQDSPRQNVVVFVLATTGALALVVGALFILGRPWPRELFIRNFAALLLCVYGGFFLSWLALRFQDPHSGGIANPTIRTVIVVLSFQGAALFLVHRFLREHTVGWSCAFGFRNGPRQALILGILVGAAILPLGWVLQMLSNFAIEALNGSVEEQEAVQILRSTQGWGNRLVLGITAIGIAPIAEEILFRGVLYSAVKQAGFRRIAFWGSSILFGAIHLNLTTFVPLTVLALTLVWLYETTDNLLAPIAAHTLFNAANFVMLYLMEYLGWAK